MESGAFTSVKEYAIHYIENYIKEHDLKAGEKLPSVSELRKSMDIGVSSVREALKILEAQGKVSIQNGKGCYVTETAQRVLISANVAEISTKNRLIEIFEVRKFLERYIIELIIKSATPEQLSALQNRVERLMFKYNNGFYTATEDRLFHLTFYSCCNNSILRGLADSVLQAFDSLYPSYSTGFHETFDDTVPFHEEMFHYVLKKDILKASEANDRVFVLILERLTK